MVVEQSNIDHIMRGLQSTEGVRLHNHRKKLRQRFDIIKKLGQGTYGKVQLGINKETGQEVAIKAIKKCKIETEADLVRIRREIQIMSSVRHPNIIHIYEVFENREKMVLVMEYAAGGELYDFLSERKVLEEPEARRIFRQISTAVYYCHKHKICHRDLKLENILLDEHGNAKIADFGLSNVYDEQRLLNSFCGSPLYASPEIVKGTPYHGPEVDCWSLGVLLYTLVYGAMPFDGSNFKRLVKQISQGVYFEPKNPSSASPLIREMLTVNPQKRATIEQICSHWWVNQGFNVSCLDIAEDLANQTPVRLDLLLSLAPPPENPEKLVVTDNPSATSQDAPARSLSVGSFMELDPNTDPRIRFFMVQEAPSDVNEKTVKRKLEPDASESSIKKESARKKERIKDSGDVKEVEESANNVVMDMEAKTGTAKAEEAAAMAATDETTEITSAKTEETKTPEEAEKVPTESKPEGEGKKPQATSEIVKDKPARKSVKVVKKKVVKDSDGEKKEDVETADTKVVKVKKKKKEDVAIPVQKDVEKKQKPETKEKEEAFGKEIKRDSVTRKSQSVVKDDKTSAPSEETSPPKLAERRRSKIFETAEKFMMNDPKSPTQEKPKKVFIPGVKVSDFAKAFERKSSLTSTPSIKGSPSKKSISKETPERKSPAKESPEAKPETENSSQSTEQTEAIPEPEAEERKPTEITDEKLKKLKDSARNIISNALVEEERKKIKKQILKPPVSKAKSEEDEGKRPITLQIGKETATVQVHSPENAKFLFDSPAEAASGENKENIEAPGTEKKTSKMEITLRSNTLPRGGTSKAEVRLNSPPAQEKIGNFRTEVEQRVGDPQDAFTTQRSEVTFPVSAAQRPVRSMSLEPELRKQPQPAKERIIPIQLEDGGQKEESEARDSVRDLDRPEARSKLPYQRTLSQRSSSLSRQSTVDSDTEATPAAPGEAIKKSPREFIIPIAVEGGGYVTPRATSLEPSDTLSSKRGIRPFPRKIGSLWSDNGSEDESPFSTLQRHPSRDTDEPFRLHRLRSTRPMRTSLDRGDSASGSEEEEEDDDGFEILTAENLFSTLLSRVRSLTQRLNVDSGIRPGFPPSRLMNHFGPSERLFPNFHHPLQTSHASIKYRTSVEKLSERPEFGRSLSRELENGFNRWSRGDLPNSDSTRSMRDKSKRCESDTESISESSYRSRRTKGDKKSKKTSSRTKADAEESHRERISRTYNPRSYQRQVSDSELMDRVLPALHRTMSLKSEGTRRKPERMSVGICEEFAERDGAKDFYEILAEKYGIRNVKRYDIQREKSPEKAEEAPEPEKVAEVLPPIPPKPKKEEEKHKTPSEKLAAVLNLNKTKSEKAKTKRSDELKVIDRERLAGLSPQALELYEKTLALYQKEEPRGKSEIPKMKEKRETPEKSVLSKYLQGMDGSKSEAELKSSDEYFKERKLKHYGSLRSRLTEKKKEEEATPQRRRSLKENGTAEKEKGKIMALEKKLRGEKKYLDRAIRSLRESSVGPKDVASENVLIKRAVSVSDCSAEKPGQSGRIVSGMLKKMEQSEANGEESKILRPKEPPRRPSLSSFIPRNEASLLNRSPSSLLGLDDSSSLRSPDSESFDSWSNCSDLGSPDDFYLRSVRHSAGNFDEMSTESVGERIRRKSFYTRFNERKKPRKSSILDFRKKYEEEPAPQKLRDDSRSRPLQNAEPEPPVHRKASLEWPKPIATPAFIRSVSQSSSLSGHATLSRGYLGSPHRAETVKRSLSPNSRYHDNDNRRQT